MRYNPRIVCEKGKHYHIFSIKTLYYLQQRNFFFAKDPIDDFSWRRIC